MADASPLFTPTRLGDIPLANRVVMAPMTRSRAPQGVPTALNAEYYAQRASAGLIITEGTSPTPEGRGYTHIPGLYSPAQIEGWRGVAKAVHARGGRIVAQIMHTGRIAHPDNMDGARVVGPSAIAASGQMFTAAGPQDHPVPHALTEAEIEATIEGYAQAARNAVAAGLDGIEVHGANGYLPNQFLAPSANGRTDRWGGSAANRARFLLAVLDASIAAIGAGRVGLRVSPGNPFNDIADPALEETYTELFAELGRRDFAYLHLFGTDPGFDVPALAARLSGKKLILNGGYDRARAEGELAAGRAQAISFGSAFIANPDLPERLRRGAALATPDRATFYGGDARGYTDYPALPAARAA
ncbi:alkene reductase [Falsiroseomonas oryzae]|uniref:alkene reductase n=1 Tax=Falsiroseomonas oryzae TaxID=2766473 RepID=UPI0022EAC682|nr:alkene reductase [Roseomonas sp. MO-31]